MKQPKPAGKFPPVYLHGEPKPVVVRPQMSDRERRDQMRKDFDKRVEAEKRSRQK